MTKPTDTTIEIWIKLTRSHQRILTAIELALKETGLPALAWYDVLLELERVGKKGMRPFELQKNLLLPQYSLSRLLDRIETAGLLSREICNEDGRGQRIFISPAGKKMRKKMWAVYGATLVKEIGDKMTAGDHKQLARLLQQLR